MKSKTALHARCDDCGKLWDIGNIVPLDECECLVERLEPGCEVPAGECPDEDCHAFCYLEAQEVPLITVSSSRPRL